MFESWIRRNRRKAISITVHDVVELFETLVGRPAPGALVGSDVASVAFTAGNCNECIRRIVPRLRRIADKRKPKKRRRRG